MNLISIFGAGLILGAAVIIVLPEAAGIIINAKYNLNRLAGVVPEEGVIVTEDMSTTIGTAVMAGFALMMFITEIFVIINERAQKAKKEEAARVAAQGEGAKISPKKSRKEESPAEEKLLSKEQHEENKREPPIDKETSVSQVADSDEIRASQSALLTTVALVIHSLTEGIAMGSSMYRK